MNFNGYYKSESKEFVDWYAGRKIVDFKHVYIKFNIDGIFIMREKTPDFDFVSFAKKQSKEDCLKNYSIPYGVYRCENDLLFLDIKKDVNWTRCFKYKIIDSESFVDLEDDRVYHFIPVDDPEFEKLPM